MGREKEREAVMCVSVGVRVCVREKGHLCAFVHACTCVCVRELERERGKKH